MLSHVAPAKQRLISHCVIDLLDVRDLHLGLPDTAVEIQRLGLRNMLAFNTFR